MEAANLSRRADAWCAGGALRPSGIRSGPDRIMAIDRRLPWQPWLPWKQEIGQPQPDPLTSSTRPIFTPIKLKGVSGQGLFSIAKILSTVARIFSITKIVIDRFRFRWMYYSNTKIQEDTLAEFNHIQRPKPRGSFAWRPSSCKAQREKAYSSGGRQGRLSAA
jgi:hypothetical protein